MQSMFRAERRSLSESRAAPPTKAERAARPADLRHRVRPAFLAAAVAVAAACLIVLLLVAGQAAAAAAATRMAEPQTTEANDSGRLLVTLPWGCASGQVGLSTPTEGLARGPEALGTAPDGRIAILDSVNRRIVVLNPDGNWKADLPISLSDPRFLCVTTDHLAVLDPDTDRLCLVLDWTGDVLQSLPIPRSQDPPTGVFLVDGRPWVEFAHANCRSLGRTASEAHEGRPLMIGAEHRWVTAARQADGQASISIQAARSACGSPATARIGGPGIIEHITSLDADTAGNVILGTRMAEGGILVRRMVGTTDRESASMLLPETTGPYLGVPYTIRPDGRVLRVEATASGYCIWIHGFAESGQSEPAGHTDEPAHEVAP